jgi:putative Mg2+ transporter-C (MgtC) family protein
MTMPLYPNWWDIAIRLLLTMLAGAIIGTNRGLRGQAAGLRTTILVGVAASVAMVQANILLSLEGKPSTSFVVMDLMRLPLGILTGVGFIGGGAILRRGDLVTGVTTAATLWVMTVIGLCLGGGQIELGIAATILAAFTLWVLKWADVRIPRDHRALVVIAAKAGSSIPLDLPPAIGVLGYTAQFCRQSRDEDAEDSRVWIEVYWRRAELAGPPLDLLKFLNEHYSVVSFEITSGLSPSPE